MRIDIKTNGPVKDNDLRALYLLHEAMRISTPRMVEANLRFALESFNASKKKQHSNPEQSLMENNEKNTLKEGDVLINNATGLTCIVNKIDESTNTIVLKLTFGSIAEYDLDTIFKLFRKKQ